jgi:uncharacterized protein (DUF697 family)
MHASVHHALTLAAAAALLPCAEAQADHIVPGQAPLVTEINWNDVPGDP